MMQVQEGSERTLKLGQFFRFSSHGLHEGLSPLRGTAQGDVRSVAVIYDPAHL